MAYSEQLADRIRERFEMLDNIEEKRMMGGLVFMYNDKMCVGVMKDELMCRIDPALHDECVEKRGCRTLDFVTRPMSGYLLVDETGMKLNKDLEYWIGLALDFNRRAKSSKPKKKNT